MLTHKALNNYEWRCLHERLDRAVAEAALGYLRNLTLRRIRINAQQLIDELNELRLGREPDYYVPGLPLVYALKYMPRRIVSIFGSLLSVLDGCYPKIVSWIIDYHWRETEGILEYHFIKCTSIRHI
jgi:hypothetical protein